jgi:hypothetical protein
VYWPPTPVLKSYTVIDTSADDGSTTGTFIDRQP